MAGFYLCSQSTLNYYKINVIQKKLNHKQFVIVEGNAINT